MPTLSLVDSHVHFWNPARLRYGWLEQAGKLNRPYLPVDLDEALKTTPARLEKIVFVEAGRDPAQNVDEARWIGELAAKDPRIQGIVAHAAVERGGAVRDELAALARYPLVKGVRRLLQDETDVAYCLRPAFVEGVQALHDFGFTFDLCIFHPQLAAVLELVRRCPKVDFVLDHLGKPGVRAGLHEPWKKELRELAALPNVVCKLSGLTTEADHATWTAEQLRPYLEHVLECFGYDRVLFGSDWPVSTLATTYARWVETLIALCDRARATDAQRRQLFQGTAERLYRLS